jgi:hypothetical protein
MERFTKRLENNDVKLNITYGEPPYPVVTNSFIKRLAEYEDTGLTPQEIEQMKARMPLHKWAGESPEKMSIFGIPVSKIIAWANANKQGRLVIYDEEAMLAMAKANAKIEEDKLELLRMINKLATQQSTVKVNV